jgi:hypothetical protein
MSDDSNIEGTVPDDASIKLCEEAKEAYNNILKELRIDKKPTFGMTRNLIIEHIKSIVYAKDGISLDKNIDEFNKYLIRASDHLKINPPSNVEMTPEESFTQLLKQSAILIFEIARKKKSIIADFTKENINVGASTGDLNAQLLAPKNNPLTSLEQNYINRKWISGSPKNAIFQLIKNNLETNDFNNLKALLHVMALPRKNVFFTASYAETGSIKAFLKLINTPEYSDFKQKIAPNKGNRPIEKKDIIDFIGNNFESQKSFKFN